MRFHITDELSSEGPSNFNPVFSMQPWNYWTALATSRMSGLLEVNNLILNTIARKETGENINLVPTLSPMGYKNYINDQLFTYIEDFIDVFTLFPVIILFLRMTSSMLK